MKPSAQVLCNRIQKFHEQSAAVHKMSSAAVYKMLSAAVYKMAIAAVYNMSIPFFHTITFWNITIPFFLHPKNSLDAGRILMIKNYRTFLETVCLSRAPKITCNIHRTDAKNVAWTL